MLLKNANILVVGLGGVGSYAAEFIARAGVNKPGDVASNCLIAQPGVYHLRM